MTLLCLSSELMAKLKESPVLVVGAGGIGCELLKNLVMVGFENIEIIDLDTIEVSNLNRQFLFQKQHVGKSKAEVARETVLKFNPNPKITAHCGSIIAPDYSVSYFQQFKLVMNALDNLEARKHVNRMCLAANVPLIESGTAGYAGQVEVIVKGKTKCYECEEKPRPKTYASCTIRNTPSQHIHCTIWAKFLFNQLFGQPGGDEDEDVSPDTANPDAAGSAAKAAITLPEKPRISTQAWAKENGYDPVKIFNKVFNEDIKYLLSIEDLWVTRKPPVPLPYGEFPKETKGDNGSAPDATPEGALPDQKLWTIQECAEKFIESLNNLKKSLESAGEGNYLVWDKDEDDHMTFVASCANLRAHIFSIEKKSKFDIKSMAGNIIPAIATSNAIIASMVTMYALKVLDEKPLTECPIAYLRQGLTVRGGYIVPEKLLSPPNPKCVICGDKPQITLVTNLNKFTIKELEQGVLKEKLSMPAPDVTAKSAVIISSEDGENDEKYISRTLSEAGIVNGDTLEVDDFIQTYSLKIIVNHREMKTGEPDFFILGDLKDLKKELAKLEKEKEKEASNGAGSSKDTNMDTTVGDDNDMEIVDESDAKKRKIGNEAVPVKKRKTDQDVQDKEKETTEAIKVKSTDDSSVIV